jgi:hypothetical protein
MRQGAHPSSFPTAYSMHEIAKASLHGSPFFPLPKLCDQVDSKQAYSHDAEGNEESQKNFS